MNTLTTTLAAWLPLLPAALMALATALPLHRAAAPATHWRRWRGLAWAGVVASGASLLLAWSAPGAAAGTALPWLTTGVFGAALALLVQWLGTVIGGFSARYLAGEPRQAASVAALSAVLASVHLLLLADHWVVLIAAWAAVGVALQRLLCFYPDRPFALLAAHKKRLADRLADALLLVAAGLSWHTVGSGSLSALWAHVDSAGAAWPLQVAAMCLVLAVVLRTALLPVHGWLIQVMEAPTPVSALLHAGVVNLGGFVLIRFAPLLEAVPAARWLLVAVGLLTAVLAGLVMLTRISIKVRLAWSTVAQMGFMVLECGLGLYTLAALHLLGHSLYKAHAFLSASGAVRQTRVDALRRNEPPSWPALWLSPLLAAAVLAAVLWVMPGAAWPLWWSGVLALAWAPLLWWPALRSAGAALSLWRVATGLALLAALSALMALAHALPLGLSDQPFDAAGPLALAGMAVMYLALLGVQHPTPLMESARRWSYAGFYLDEFFTRVALRLWPTDWAGASASGPRPRASARPAVEPR